MATAELTNGTTGVGNVGPRVSAWFANPYVKLSQKVALGAFLVLAFTRGFFPAPIGVLVLGAINGSIFALTALGIVLVYRANRVINFAQGDLGAVGGILGVLLLVKNGFPFFIAMFLGLLAGIALGGLAEFLFVRRFANAPRLILTVATLGIAQLFQGLEVGIPSLFGTNFAPQINSTPLDFFKKKLTAGDPIIFGGSHLFAVLVVLAATVGLGLFFRYTRIGIAVRGSAESAERASQLGIPVKRIGTLVWMIAAGLSALSLLLQAPIGGIPIGTALGPTLLMRALAAAVIGRMENLWVTFMAAVGIGVLEQSAKFATGRGTLGDAIVFAIIMAAFFLQKKGKVTRADDAGASSWSLIKETRPIPPELAGDPLLRLTRVGISTVLAVLLLGVPLLMPALKVNLLLEQAVLFAIVGISLIILTGWGGEVSIGQIAFFGLGATLAARLAVEGVNFFLCVLAAGLLGAVASLVIGVPALRIRGPFLAVATLGLALTTSSFFLDPYYFPWFVIDKREVIERPVLFGKFDTSSEWTMYYVLLTFLALVLMSVRSFRNSRSGRALIGSRDNSRAAQAYGISVIRARLWAFAMSGFFAALAGGLFTFNQEGLSTTAFNANRSILVFTLVVVGGMGSPLGALLGAAYFTIVSYAITAPAAQLFVQGIGLLLILLVFPGGLGGGTYDLRDAGLRWLARKRGIVVASLLADRRIEEEAEKAGLVHAPELTDALQGFEEEDLELTHGVGPAPVILNPGGAK